MLSTYMTSGSQTHQEVVRLRESFASPKAILDIGFWNVRTMFQSSKVQQVAREFREYKLEVLGISEARWSGSGKMVLTSGETVLWSGREVGHESGVALMLSKHAAKCLEEWKPVSDRILIARFFSRYVATTIVVCYAPTNEADDEAKEQFYGQLQATVRRVPKHDLVIVGGDFNAKVGGDNRNRERTMGKFGLGNMNENGLLFAEFCEEHELVIGGTMFQHKEVHRYTWESPDGLTRNQIDHIAVCRRWAASLQDVRTRRGADVGSDHMLVVAKVKLSLRKKPKVVMRKKLNVEKFKVQEVVEEFRVRLSNRFEVLEGLEIEDVDSYWSEVKDALKDTGEQVLGNRMKKKKEWLTNETWRLIDERKEISKRLLNEELVDGVRQSLKDDYRAKERETKRRVRQDKREFVDGLAQEAEEAERRHDSRSLFQISKQLCKKPSFANASQVFSRDGVLLTKEAEQRDRWAEHFNDVLNKEDPARSPVFQEGDVLDVNVGKLSIDEIKSCIGKMKSNKAAGCDGVAAELYKACPDEIAKVLDKLFSRIWEVEKIPEEWLRGIIVKLPKKGDLRVADNWRGITLLVVALKIFARGLFDRLQGPLERILRKNQAGFRKGRSCRDQIFVLRKMIEEAQEFQRSLVINFVDFEKAFDCVFREGLWMILREYGVPEKMVRLIRATYDGFKCAVLHEGELSSFFAVESGVKQGCLLSGLLFVIVIDWLMKRTTEGRDTGVEWVNGEILEDIDYADDLALPSEGYEDAQEKMTRLARRARGVGLKVNAKKTEILRLNCWDQSPITLEGQVLRDVDNFTYLGSTLNKTGGSHEDIGARIGKAWGSFTKMRSIWSSRVYRLKTKLRLFSSIVKSTLLYGCECWTLTKADEKRLRVFHLRCLRRILRIFYPNLVRNQIVLERSGERDIIEEVRDRKWRWIGHIARREEGHLTKQALGFHMEGRRRRGRPRETWDRVVRREFSLATGLSFDRVVEYAQDRLQWRLLVDAVRAATAHRD